VRGRHLNRRLHARVLQLTLGIFVAGSSAAPTSARAEVFDELLDILRAKGEITQPEYDKLKARYQAELKGGDAKRRATEAKAREAEAKAREAEAKAARPAPVSVLPTVKGPAPAYVSKCVGMMVGAVDICLNGDISFFGIEQFPDKNPHPPAINGGLATASQRNSYATSVGLLPSSIQVSLTTTQMGIDVSAVFAAFVGGNNVDYGTFGANNGGSPVALGSPAIDFRKVYGTLGTPTFGTVKFGRDIGLFASDAILNDQTIFGGGSPLDNFKPNNTTLGRIGLGYIYADWIPQLTYKSPSYNGFTVAAGLFTPLDEVPFSGDPNSATLTGHDSPQVQGQLKYVGNIMPDLKLTLSTSGTVQRQQADCTASIPTFGTSSCIGAAPLVSSAGLSPGTSVTAWAVDGFARLDYGPVSLVATGYTGRGVGTTGLFFDGVAADGSARRSDGGYIQASYEFFNTLTLGGSWGVSVLDTADAQDAAAEFASCRAAVATCLVHSNESWILFANYKLTTWAELQAEFVQTRAENQIGQKITDNAVLAGVTFFW
jgi:predicted porin